MQSSEPHISRLLYRVRTAFVRLDVILVGFIGFTTFHFLFGIHILSPENYEWLGTGDRVQALSGWLHFRHSAWQWPLGRIDNFVHPVGTWVAYTDSIPWLCILFKVLDPLLPDRFQFFGLWLALCYVMQGLFGYLFIKTSKIGNLPALLGAALFCLSPVLVHRNFHLTLCGQWLIVASMWLFSRKRLLPQTKPVWQLVVTIIAAATHPYLAIMVLSLALADYTSSLVALWQRERWRWFRWILSLPIVTGLTFWSMGYFEVADRGSGGFGSYSANLLSFIAPLGTSLLQVGVEVIPSQYEGYGYLGAGVLLLIVSSFAYAAIGKAARHRNLHFKIDLDFGALYVPAVILAVFALSSHIYLGQFELVDLSWGYDMIPSIVGPFRASGRFIWPLYYLILGSAVIVVGVTHPMKISSVILTIAVIAQIWDCWPQFSQWKDRTTGVDPSLPFHEDAVWRSIGLEFNRIALIPPQVIGGHCLEGEIHQDPIYASLSTLAASQKIAVNSGYLSRSDSVKVAQHCSLETESFKSGLIEELTIYFVHSDYLKDLNLPHNPNLICRREAQNASDIHVCVASSRVTKLSAWIVERGQYKI